VAGRPPGGVRVRVGIDATLLRPGRVTGVERYATELICAVAERAAGEIVLFTRPDVPEPVRGLAVERHRAPLVARLPVDQLWLPYAAGRAAVELLHLLAFPAPVAWRGPTVQTVHDATPWLFPETVSTGMRLYHRPLFPRALRRAAAVLAPSRAACADLVATGLVPEGRIRVIPEGVPRCFAGATRATPAGVPYVLFVGTIEPRKNLEVLLAAFRLVLGGRDRLELVLAGRSGWGAMPEPRDLGGRVRRVGHVADDELVRLYEGASCLVLPSLYEGFGLPLLEAMATGTPAVASDIPALRELGGDSVRYTDPRDPAALARAIEACLADVESTRILAARARLRAGEYRWDRCADATLAVYREVLDRYRCGRRGAGRAGNAARVRTAPPPSSRSGP